MKKIKHYNKPLRQKKGRAGLLERVDYGVSSTKVFCVIWAVEGGVKCADVGLALEVGDMLVSRRGVVIRSNQGGTAENCIFALDLHIFMQVRGFFVVIFERQV